jgi:hypothetical protein
MSKNHFRSLASTASPGGSAMQVNPRMQSSFITPPRFVQLALVAVAFLADTI